MRSLVWLKHSRGNSNCRGNNNRRLLVLTVSLDTILHNRYDLYFSGVPMIVFKEDIKLSMFNVQFIPFQNSILNNAIYLSILSIYL